MIIIILNNIYLKKQPFHHVKALSLSLQHLLHREFIGWPGEQHWLCNLRKTLVATDFGTHCYLRFSLFCSVLFCLHLCWVGRPCAKNSLLELACSYLAWMIHYFSSMKWSATNYATSLPVFFFRKKIAVVFSITIVNMNWNCSFSIKKCLFRISSYDL